MEAKTKIISIKEIILDQRFYPRFHTDQQRVREFVRAMEYGEFFEPVKVVFNKKTGQHILLDGNHRMKARIIRGETEIEVYILDIPEEHVLLNAARLNDKSSKPLSPDEIKHVIISAWQNGVRDTADIAKELGRSQRWVRMVLQPVRDEERNQRDKKILELYRQGMSQRQISAKIGLSFSCVNSIVRESENACNEEDSNQNIPGADLPDESLEAYQVIGNGSHFRYRSTNKNYHINTLDESIKKTTPELTPENSSKALILSPETEQNIESAQNKIGFVPVESKKKSDTAEAFGKRNDFVSRTPDKKNNIKLLSDTPTKTSPEPTLESSPSTEEPSSKEQISSEKKSSYPTYLDQIDLYNELPEKCQHAMRAMELAKHYKLDVIDIIKEIKEPVLWTRKVLVAAIALSLMNGGYMEDASHVETALGIGFDVARTIQDALPFNTMLCPVAPEMAQWLEDNISAKDLEVIAALTGEKEDDLPYLIRKEKPPSKKRHFEKLPDEYKDHLKSNVQVLRELRTHARNHMFRGDSAKQLVGHLNKNMTAMNEIFEALRELQIF
jgi:hypothetical protein